MGLKTDFFEKLCSVLRCGNDGYKITIVDQMITTWDRKLSFALNGTEQNITLVFVCDL